ncbi:RNA polymerase Rpb1 C-terminal repeat domain-containing protein [Trichophyton interdigitale]|uniref:RNA polymerase Rpb1 C-terminal repeat domain-containing protein n=1 Tax=Trichophyton interdigitale TaxID=101480 RepID=A0A9P4YHF1_9EURO|nr:RNA polymerase Rpb1 C-terminal repeat domain-containing protein [Trichophyton interdigitale]KAF3895221.1 RNA polymerase Rpb1 C-terminal repeat domain-containing protein [Trichophyton interdigitale]KAG8209854.1 RNA polymerase Rpb1 C-terminal repeat domain-containing protein [Trichophyton interdigitale]
MAKKGAKNKDKETKAKGGKGKASKKQQKQKQEEEEEKVQTEQQAQQPEDDQSTSVESEQAQAQTEDPLQKPEEDPKSDEAAQPVEDSKPDEEPKPEAEVIPEEPKAEEEPKVEEEPKAEEPKTEIESTSEEPKPEEETKVEEVATEEPKVEDEPVVEAPAVEESPLTEEAPLAAEAPAAEEPAQVEDAPIAGEVPPVEETSPIEDVAVTEEVPTVEEQEPPKIDEEPRAEDDLKVDEAPKVEELPAEEETKAEDQLGTTEEPIPDEPQPVEEAVPTEEANPEEASLEETKPQDTAPEVEEKFEEAAPEPETQVEEDKFEETIPEQEAKLEENVVSDIVPLPEEVQQEGDKQPEQTTESVKEDERAWDEQEQEEQETVIEAPIAQKSPSPSPAPSQVQLSPSKTPSKPPSIIQSLPPLPRSITSTPSNLSLSQAFPSPKLSSSGSQGKPGGKGTSTVAGDEFQEAEEVVPPVATNTSHKGRSASPRSQYDVTDSDYQTAYGSAKTPTTRAVSNGAYSPSDVPLPSPSVSEARTKSASPPGPSYEYTHQPQPIPAAAPHFAYPYPYAHLYQQNSNYPSSPVMEQTPANVVTPQYSPVMHPSPQPNYATSFSQQQGRRASRSSRSQYDYYFGNTSQYRSARESMSQPTENGKPHLNGERDLADTVNLLHRIQNVIPDLNKLVVSYREAQSQLSAREAENKQIEAQHEQALLHKEYYIEALQNQMRKVANEHAEECSKLKGKIGALGVELSDLQERNRNTEDTLVETQKARDDLLRARDELESEVDHIQKEIEAAREAHERDIVRLRMEAEKSEEKALAEQKERLEDLFQEIKNEDDRLAAEHLKAREDELLGQLAAKQEELDAKDAALKSKVEELRVTQEELDEKKAELAEKFSELEALKEELVNTKNDLEAKQQECESRQNELELTRKDLEETKRHHEEELAALRDALDIQTNNVKEIKERLANMVLEHRTQEETWQKAREGYEAQLSEKAEELKLSNEEKEVLEREGLAKEERLQSIVEEMRQTHNNLNKDRERLKKTLHSLGEATDMKMKGDSFFIESFAELSRLIVEVSKTYFTYLPIEPPPDILAKIPSDIPQFLDNTPASRELRAAYVQHVISKTLTYRIFQPFLFTLGRRYDKADTFFQMLSIDIRRKSVRREAFWRQQTLKAAYTTSDAKQAINVVAAVIVDEIVDHIRHFTDPTHLDSLLTNVRKIVKLAAETWRLARVERELITATMPSAEDEQTANEEWEEFDYESNAPLPGGEGTAEPPLTPKKFRRPLLRMLPRIFRGAVHEDFLTEDDHEKASPCTYLRGVILYSDSPSVLARRAEMFKKKPEAVGVIDDAEDARLRAASATPPNASGRSPSPKSPLGNRSPRSRRSRERAFGHDD